MTNNLLIQATEFQTPIETALGVDENGMTTARNLYEFLGLSKGQFSRWAKSNITDNQFATEGEDYWGFDIYVEGNLTRDYKLTAHFAKKLSVKGNSARSEEAREYFTQLEEKAKQRVIDRTQLSPQLQALNMVVESLNRQELEQKRIAAEQERQNKKLEEIEERQTAMADAFQNQPGGDDFRTWVNRCVARIAESPKYDRGFGRSLNYSLAREESYDRLKKKWSCNLSDRVTRARKRAIKVNPGITKTELNAINKLSVIANDKSLRPVYETVIREMMLQYCVE